MISLDNALWLTGIVTEAALIGLLLYRRAWKNFPIFTVLCIWDLLSGVGNYAVLHYSPSSYLNIYFAEIVIGTALELSVLVELAWSVLRPLRSSLTYRTLIGVGILILAVGATIWPVSGIHKQAQISLEGYWLVHLMQTLSILRVLFFLTLAACSQLLSIGWRDRELQVATGLGFYSLVSLGAAMLRTHLTTSSQYSHLNQFVVAGYVCSLLYWLTAFAQKEAKRREFTPQMERFLLAVAGAARTQRIALSDSRGSEGPGR